MIRLAPAGLSPWSSPPSPRPAQPRPSPRRRRRRARRARRGGALAGAADGLSAPRAAERASGLHRARHAHAERGGAGLVQGGRQGRSEGPLRLRAPVRAPDVQGHARHARGHVRPADRGRRRDQQRLHQRRLHRVPRGGAGQLSAADPVGRGRADGLAGRRRGRLPLRAQRGGGGAAPAGAGRALRRAVLPADARGLLHREPLRAAHDRLDRGPGRRDARRRAGLPRGLVPAGQRGAGGGRELRPGPAQQLDRPVFRQAAAARLADPAPAAGRAGPQPGADLDRLRAQHPAAGAAVHLSRAAGGQPRHARAGGGRRDPGRRRQLAPAPGAGLSRPDRPVGLHPLRAAPAARRLRRGHDPEPRRDPGSRPGGAAGPGRRHAHASAHGRGARAGEEPARHPDPAQPRDGQRQGQRARRRGRALRRRRRGEPRGGRDREGLRRRRPAHRPDVLEQRHARRGPLPVRREQAGQRRRARALAADPAARPDRAAGRRGPHARPARASASSRPRPARR